MSNFMFRVEEVTRDGFIAWDAVEECSGDRFPLNVNGSYDAGKFPEITDFLTSKYGINFDVSYCDNGSDSLNNDDLSPSLSSHNNQFVFLSLG